QWPESRLVMHLRVIRDPEAEIHIVEPAFPCHADLAEDREYAEAACGFVRIEAGVDRGKSRCAEIGCSQRDQPAAIAHLDEAGRTPRRAQETLEILGLRVVHAAAR